MESLVLISSDLRLASPNFFLYHWPKVSLMLRAALLLILVWEEFSGQRSVKRFFEESLKRLMSS
jgi:hypothetical protein